MSRSAPPNTIGNRLAPPRFILFVLLFAIGTGALLQFDGRAAESIMTGFDIAAGVFLLSVVPLLSSEPATMRVHAASNDANRIMLLAITGAVMVVILVVVAKELGDASESRALILGTLTIAWLFSNGVYALHYAHLYYMPARTTGGDAGGIDFPKTDEPDYWDFVYFAFTLGMTFQTSDVAITGRRIRRVVIVHSFAAFLFNLGVIAFTINVLGSARP